MLRVDLVGLAFLMRVEYTLSLVRVIGAYLELTSLVLHVVCRQK
jgi:hypothetical protein